MPASLKRFQFSAALPLGVVCVISATALLEGCVVGVAAPPPPRVYVAPPPVYVPPPPPVYAAPAVDVEVRANEAPPPLPDYVQPPCPEDGYLWTPGYWAWGPGGYYWVPGTWVQPPRYGVLWTPGYWGFVGGVYAFHAGYWGPHIGFYGGVNYGFGYGGVGFAGGRWVGNSFSYNQSVTNINVTVVHNTYNQTIVNNVTVNRVSFNGGAGGIAAAPTPQERMAAQEPHVPPTAMQQQHIHEAARNPAMFARANGGRPSIAATPRPAAFNAPGVVGAHGAAAPPPRPYQAANGNRGAGAPFAANQPNAVARQKAANQHPRTPPPQNKRRDAENGK
jgi:WXXGXW repeat (2 copies)